MSSTLSTHVLDTTTGTPAVGMKVTVERKADEDWQRVGEGRTDVNGRVVSLAGSLQPGIYRLVFDSGGYGTPFYPEVHILVVVDEAEGHYHIPLLLSHYGYTTYRGT